MCGLSDSIRVVFDAVTRHPEPRRDRLRRQNVIGLHARFDELRLAVSGRFVPET
jgi:hypothetical protein